MNDIREALSRAAESSTATPLALVTVHRRARRIRRRRTATALAGTVAAVAAIAGLGVSLGPSGSPDSADHHRPPVATRPTGTPEAERIGPVFGVRLDVDADQTFGDDPRIPFWSDGEIVDVDGSTTPLADRPLTFAKDPTTSGWVVVRAGRTGAELVRLGADGTQAGAPLPTVDHGLAVDADGTLAVLAQEPSGWTLTVGARRIALGAGVESAKVDGFTEARDVVLEVNGVLQVARTADGRLDLLGPEQTAVASPHVPFTAIGRSDGTWVAHGPAGGADRWSLDWAGVSSFSPDGAYVALSGDRQHRIPASADWDSDWATGTLWIRTADGLGPVAAFTAPTGGYFGRWAWEGDDLLATVYVKGEWSLVRLTAEGPRVGRGTTRAGGGEDPAYVFAAQ